VNVPLEGLTPRNLRIQVKLFGVKPVPASAGRYQTMRSSEAEPLDGLTRSLARSQTSLSRPNAYLCSRLSAHPIDPTITHRLDHRVRGASSIETASCDRRPAPRRRSLCGPSRRPQFSCSATVTTPSIAATRRRSWRRSEKASPWSARHRCDREYLDGRMRPCRPALACTIDIARPA
jgi:hypothetical protein